MRQSAEYQLGAQSAREDAEGASHAELKVLIRRSQAGDWGDDYDRGYRNTLNEIVREASAHGDVPFANLGKEKPRRSGARFGKSSVLTRGPTRPS